MTVSPFRGYVRTVGKKPTQKFAHGERLLTFEEAGRFPEFAGILGGEFTVKDIDTAEESEKLYRLVADRDINCRVMRTRRGMQFFFRKSRWASKSLTHQVDALGLEFDTRAGSNSYCVLKQDGALREVVRDFDEERDIAEYPPWLAPLPGAVRFTGMAEGSGRNGALFSHTARLLRAGYPKAMVIDVCEMINDYVFDESLPESEMAKILRDETFEGFERASAADDFAGTPVRPEDFSDTGMAAAFAAASEETLRFCTAYGWLAWNGTVWEASDLKAQQREMDFTGVMLADALDALLAAYSALAIAESSDDEDAKERAKSALKDAQAYQKFAMKMREHSKVTGVLKLARSALEIDISELDADSHLLNTPGGMVELRTGQMRPHRSDALCTKITGASPGTEGAKLWQLCLDSVTGGDKELQKFLQCLAGAMAIGHVYHEALVIAHGDGVNGKSTFFNTIHAVMGDYSGKIPAEALTTKAKSVKVDLAELVGKRFVLASETEEGQRLSVSMLKQIASVDAISAERKYRDPFVFKPTHTTVLYTNHLPKVGSGDRGTWRRLVVAPFTQKIERPEPDFADRLVTQASGAVMSWIVEGARLFTDAGYKLPECAAINAAVHDYRESNDWFGAFLAERCEVNEGSEAPSGELYRTYREWAAAQGEYVRSTTDFSTALHGAGFEKKKLRSGIVWRGLALVSDFLTDEEFPL
jgi:P4 family phage/plasmid primase-like protien